MCWAGLVPTKRQTYKRIERKREREREREIAGSEGARERGVGERCGISKAIQKYRETYADMQILKGREATG